MNRQKHEQHNGKKHSHREHHEHMIRDFKIRFWVSLVLTVPVLALSEMIQSFVGLEKTIEFPYQGYIQFVLSTVIFFYGGWPFLKGLVKELRKRQPGMMTLIALAVTVAWGYSTLVIFGLRGKVFFWELATLIDVMLLGHWIEMRSVQAASGSLEKLVQMMPNDAHRLKDDGSTETVSIEDLRKEDRVLVKPGEKIPIDGRIVEGRSQVNQAMITGESKPVEKQQDDEVIAGTVNGESSLTIEVQKTGDETYLSQVIKLVNEAQQSKSRSQTLADRAAFWLTVVALSVAAVTLAAWLLGGRDFAYSLERSVTVMITTCPHALGLAIPLVVAVSTALAAGRGLLIRNRQAFESSRGIDAVVFDKTGTLTRGEFELSEIVVLGGEYDEEAVLAFAAGVENQSEHTIAAAVVEAAKEKKLDLKKAEEFSAIPGKGAQARIEGKNIKVVSRAWLDENDIQYDQEKIQDRLESGATTIFVLIDDAPVGAIFVDDQLRDESKQAVRSLKENGVRVMMITGDAEPVAKRIAAQLELDEYFAEVLPDKKADKIKELRENGLRVAMVGDGINDAPALAAADVGVAIGAGTDVAIESADIVLVESNPLDVVDIIDLARKTYRKMIQNLWWAAGYNIVAIPLAAGVLFWAGFVLPPAAGAVIMSASTVIVAINAQLLKFQAKSA